MKKGVKFTVAVGMSVVCCCVLMTVLAFNAAKIGTWYSPFKSGGKGLTNQSDGSSALSDNSVNSNIMNGGLTVKADSLDEVGAESGEPSQAKDSAKENGLRINSDTVIMYKYYDETGVHKTSTEMPPYFLLDMTRDEFEEALNGWTVESFSSEEAVVRKNVPGRQSATYIVGVSNGFVAVFHDNPEGAVLKEITKMPVSSLSDDEQKKLTAGIHVSGEEKLMKLLEDYGS